HSVSELVTGIDLVKEQIRLACGEKLNIKQDKIQCKGHAIECRINAEDPERDFVPSPGMITGLVSPGGPGIRIDTHIHSGYQIPPFYDSMLAKLLVLDNNRQGAICRMQRALNEFIIEGIKTTIPFHQKVMENAFFRKGEVYTNFIQRRIWPER
ncbi:acetyl-CoA carboxylase biotin carboxylase subunit, partial [bacterium]|nr:acetyl-CoA carboxylase biotin carboxylase subunit [bacterium]